MPTIKTHEICAEGITAHLVTVFAKAFGLSLGTVRSWRQPKAVVERTEPLLKEAQTA